MTGGLRREEKNLSCSMITISKNATLKKNSISIGMIPCCDCDQQKCQDIVSMNFLTVICSINTISVNVTVLQMENIMLDHNRVNFHTPLLQQKLNSMSQ